MKRYESVIAAATPGVVALFFIIGALSMPTFGAFYYAPGFFPLVIGAVMLLLSIMQTIREVGNVSRNASGAASSGTIPVRTQGWWLRTLYCIGAMIMLVALIWFRVSFIFSSALFLTATLFFYARNRVVSNIFLIVIVSVGLHYLFTRVFYIPLP